MNERTKNFAVYTVLVAIAVFCYHVAYVLSFDASMERLQETAGVVGIISLGAVAWRILMDVTGW